jgi:hypothetical protein
MQPQSIGGLVAECAPMKLFDASSIVGSEALDVRHARKSPRGNSIVQAGS